MIKIQRQKLRELIKEELENAFSVNEAEHDDEDLLFDQAEESDVSHFYEWRDLEEAIGQAMEFLGEEDVLSFLRAYVENY